MKENRREAAKMYQLAAAQGYPAAQYNLAVLYETGDGVEVDKAEAARLFKLAADQGHPIAQHRYGLCCEIGEVVSKDEREAAKYFLASAKRGYSVCSWLCICARNWSYYCGCP